MIQFLESIFDIGSQEHGRLGHVTMISFKVAFTAGFKIVISRRQRQDELIHLEEGKEHENKLNSVGSARLLTWRMLIEEFLSSAPT